MYFDFLNKRRFSIDGSVNENDVSVAWQKSFNE